MHWRRRWLIGVGTAAALALAGCGGGGIHTSAGGALNHTSAGGAITDPGKYYGTVACGLAASTPVPTTEYQVSNLPLYRLVAAASLAEVAGGIDPAYASLKTTGTRLFAHQQTLNVAAVRTDVSSLKNGCHAAGLSLSHPSGADPEATARTGCGLISDERSRDVTKLESLPEANAVAAATTLFMGAASADKARFDKLQSLGNTVTYDVTGFRKDRLRGDMGAVVDACHNSGLESNINADL